MPEEVLFSTETVESRDGVASYLRRVADRLDEGADLTLAKGEDELTLEVPARVTFEVKAERETGDGTPELSVEFELEWDEGDEQGGGDLRID